MEGGHRAEGSSPDDLVAAASNGQDQVNDTGQDESKVDHEVSGQGNKETTSTFDNLVSRLGSVSRRAGVFATNTDTEDTTVDSQHPEETLDRTAGTIGTSTESSTENDQEGGDHHSDLTTNTVNKETESDLPESDLPEDNSDKESVAAEADVDQRLHTDLVTIGHQGATFVTLEKRANKCTVRTWMVILV